MLLSLPRIYKIGIISVISIVIFSFALFYYIQTVTENNIRSNLITEQIDRQRVASKSLSQHIGSDLTLVMTVLDGLTTSGTSRRVISIQKKLITYTRKVQNNR